MQGEGGGDAEGVVSGAVVGGGAVGVVGVVAEVVRPADEHVHRLGAEGGREALVRPEPVEADGDVLEVAAGISGIDENIIESARDAQRLLIPQRGCAAGGRSVLVFNVDRLIGGGSAREAQDISALRETPGRKRMAADGSGFGDVVGAAGGGFGAARRPVDEVIVQIGVAIPIGARCIAGGAIRRIRNS